MTVERYSMIGSTFRISTDPADGDFVSVKDYENLERENAELRHDIERHIGIASAECTYAEQIIRLVGDETVKAARLHTEARRLMASNEHEHGAVYCALCALRDRIAALANHQPKEKS